DDTSFGSSTSSASTQTVNAGNVNVNVSLTSSANPSAFGQVVSFTTTVTPIPPATGTPTGTVSITIDGTPLGSFVLANGLATFNLSALSVGTHSLAAIYSGDGTFTASSSATLTQTVTRV